MGKVLKAVAIVAGVAIAFIPGVGTAVSGALAAAFSGTAIGAGATFAAVSAAGALTAGLAVIGVTGALSFGLKALGLGPKPPKVSPASVDRLRASLDPRAYRKIVFGYTAAATDVQYQEFTGADQEYLNSIVVLASHALHDIEAIYFDEKLAWDGSIGGDFTGYLSVTAREEGTAANALTITGSSSWTSSASRMVGCSYLWLRYKLTGNTKKAESPFAGGVTSRITVRVKGALLYDPRLDSTQPGGSGSHRADDQATWAWVDDDTGRNPALQLLWFLLGWRIQNPADSTWRLAVGLGLPPARIDFESFIAAANLCDEPVTLATTGTEPRYRSDGVFSEGDAPTLVIENLLAAMNGVLRDAGGKLALDVLHNDLASPVADLTDADVIGEFSWLQTPPIDQTFNTVRGRYVDSSDDGLYQMVDYPEVAIASPDDIERVDNYDLPVVQSASQAQRLAKQRLQRAQYPGTFTADFLATAWRCQVGSVVRLTFPALGFSNKLFRVVEHGIRFDGTCPMTLREEAAAIYAWDADETAPVTPAPPVSYDPLNDPFVQAIAAENAARATIRNAAIKNPRDGSDVARELLTASDAGSTATISVARHDWDYPGETADVTRALGTITGLAFDTMYYVWFDDTTLADAAPTYQATTNPALGQNSTANPGRHPVGAIRSPKDGGATQEASLGPNYGYDDVTDAVLNFGNRLERDASTPPSVTLATDGSAVEHNANLLGVDMRLAWTLSTTDEAKIHGFEVMLYQSASATAYTPGTTPLMEQRTIAGPKTRGLVAHVTDPTAYYTWAVRTYRNVDKDVDSTGRVYSAWVKPSLSGENPYRPSTSAEIADSVKIGSGGNTASNVSTWAGYASAGLNSDGSVKDDKVGTGAIIDEALIKSGWSVQTATTGITNETYDMSFGSPIVTSGPRLTLRANLIYRIVTTDPAQDDDYSFEVKGLLVQTVSPNITYTFQTQVISYKWLWSSRTGTFYTEKIGLALEWTVDGQTGSTYQPGLRFIVPAGFTVEIVGAHYLKIDDIKVAQ